MKQIGWFFILLGMGTIALGQIGREFAFLDWIDQWGVEAGWILKAAPVALGVALLLLRRPGRVESGRCRIREHPPGMADPMGELFNRHVVR